MQTLLGPVLAHLSPARVAFLTGRNFFPSLIAPAFSHGLSVAFDFAIVACVVAAIASLLRGGRYVHEEQAAAQAASAPHVGADQAVGAFVMAGDCPGGDFPDRDFPDGDRQAGNWPDANCRESDSPAEHDEDGMTRKSPRLGEPSRRLVLLTLQAKPPGGTGERSAPGRRRAGLHR